VVNKTDEAKEKIAKQKAKLELREKLIKQKERKEKTKELIQLGSLVCEAGLEHLSPTALLGAFIEAKEKSSNESTIKKWELASEKLRKFKTDTELTPLIISFSSTITIEAKDQLKNLSFKWNPFRKEWYGYGNKTEFEKLFESYKIQIEVISE
jgi:hypothetical protein